jgi:hypothetical protein
MNTNTVELFDRSVQELDLSLIIKRLQKKLEWDVSRTNLAACEYRQFLQQLLDTPDSLHYPLSVDMDEVWHMHILFTKKYDDDCRTIFGYFLHHTPSVEVEGMCCDDGDCQPSN